MFGNDSESQLSQQATLALGWLLVLRVVVVQKVVQKVVQESWLNEYAVPSSHCSTKAT